MVSAVVVAGGSSSRMGNTDKLFITVGSKTVLERSTDAMCGNELVDEVVVVASARVMDEVKKLLEGKPKLRAIVQGGATRALSVQNGIAACSPDAAYYAIHDAARPFASDALITRTILAAMEYGAAVPALAVVDTIKTADADGFCVATPDRSRLRAVATPQVFEADAYRAACAGRQDAFDDAQLAADAGMRVKLVEGERENIKITEPGDIKRARGIAGDVGMRIGHGYDVHRLCEGRKLILGGVEIPYEKGLDGHSDADVLIHAIMDALLGAAALGDIGMHFPDTDGKYKGADSGELLRETVALIAQAGYRVVNIDATVLCQAPKLRGYIDRMRENIAADCSCDTSCVSVKATTEEKLGFTGSGEGIAAHAVALLERQG